MTRENWKLKANELRKQGMTYKQIAKRANVNVGTAWVWVNGKLKPKTQLRPIAPVSQINPVAVIAPPQPSSAAKFVADKLFAQGNQLIDTATSIRNLIAQGVLK